MKAITKLWIDVGMKKQKLETEAYKRNEIMRCHGLRKFFETNAFRAGMDHMYIRRLMGQKSGLEDSYLKLSEEESLEGDSKHIGFVGIIDQLTINEENKLRREVKDLKKQNTLAEAMKRRLDKIEQLMMNPNIKNKRCKECDGFNYKQLQGQPHIEVEEKDKMFNV